MNSEKIAHALFLARKAQQTGNAALLKTAFEELDNLGAFREIDEAYDYNYTPKDAGPRMDPAEWGDLSGYTSH
jgi:hypothetical protein